MIRTESDLRREAAATGFAPDALEKSLRLLDLLNAIRMHPFLGPRLALKGGTALNFFIFRVPRLSVDIDFNYVGSASRENMLHDRSGIEQAIRGVCVRLDLIVKHVPSEHAGGKWRIGYDTISGRTGSLELDINYLIRTPLWPVVPHDSHPIGSAQATRIRVLDIHELAAGKIAALLARNAARDIFDTRELLARGEIDREKLRLAFVVYGGMNRIDWRTVHPSKIHLDPRDAERTLVPMLRQTVAPQRRDLREWTRTLLGECRDRLSAVWPMSPVETEFIARLNDDGEIAPALLTADPGIKQRIADHPGLRWKAQNVRLHRVFGAHEARRDPADEN